MDRVFRPPGRRVSPGWLMGSLVAGALLASLAGAQASCSDYEVKPWRCGVGLPADKDVPQSCSVSGQICVCETNDCAEPTAKSVCESGYRYVAAPYADPPAWAFSDAGADADAGSANSDTRCVPKEITDRTKLIASTEKNKFCPGEEPAEPSGGGAGAPASGSTGTGGTAGGGGMTGTGGSTGAAGGGGMTETGGTTSGTGGMTGGAAGGGTGGSR